MIKRHVKSVVLLTVVLFCAGLTSCVKDEYDLSKDLDKNITFGDGLAFPVGSTEKFSLSQMIDLGKNIDTVTVANPIKGLKTGDYYFHTESDANNRNSFCMDKVEVKLNNQKTKFESDEINIKPSDEQQAKLAYLPQDKAVAMPDLATLGIPTMFTEDVKNLSIDLNFTDDITNEIVALNKIEFEPVPITLTVQLDGALEKKSLVLLKDTELDLPEWIDCDPQDGMLKKEVSNGKARFILQQDLSLKAGESKTLSLKMKGVDCTSAVSKNAGKTTFSRTGKIGVENGVVGLVLPKAGEMVTLRDALSANFKVTATINNPTIHVTSASGTFEPKPGKPTSVNIDDMPDLLKDKDTKIRISNPVIDFIVYNDKGTELTLDELSIVGVNVKTTFDDKPSANGNIDLGNIDLIKSGAANIVHEGGKSIATLDKAICPNLPNIINQSQKVPNHLEISMAGTHLKGTLKPEQTYYVDYKFRVPFAFEKGTELVYSDDSDGWNSDVEDVKEAGGLTIDLVAVSTIPFKMSAKEATLIGVDGKAIDMKVVNLDQIVIEPGKAGQTAEKAIRLQVTSGNRKAIQKLDGIKICLVASVVDGYQDIVLNNSDHKISFKNIKLTIDGGITINPDDM